MKQTSTPTVSGLRRAGLAVALFAGLALLVAACGAATSVITKSRSSGGSSGSSSQTGATGAVAFAQCMRQKGVTDFPDPSGGRFLISGSVQSNPNFHTAAQSCQHLMGPNGISGSGSHNSQLLAFAHCMQTHGVPQFPDPTAGGAIGLPQGVDPNSPSFQSAWQKCKSNLPGNLQQQP